MIKDIIIRTKLLFRKDKELYFNLKEIIGFYPGDIELYKQALMHKSIMRRNEKGKPVNNERLEFLGDAVLDAVVGDIVFRHFPGKREGFLTNTRSKLVQREMLGKLAKEMGVTRLILSSGSSQSHNSYLGGNAFEALVGAIYLDRGYKACMKFVRKRILNSLVNIDKVAYKEVNFKSKLIEWAQKNRIQMEWVLLEEGKDENGSPYFRFRLMLEGVEGCEGKGFSKKEAQQMASKLTLEKLRKDKKYNASIFEAKTRRTKMEEEPVAGVPEVEDTPQPRNINTRHSQRPASKKQKGKSADAANTADAGQNLSIDAQNLSADAQNHTVEEPKAPLSQPESTASAASHRSSRPTADTLDDSDKEFDLSHITSRELTREEIIEAAEREAFEQ